MDREQVFNHYRKILDDMVNTSNFFATYFQAPYSVETDAYESVTDHIWFYCGATRGCIVDDTYDYVVKFDVDYDGTESSSCERECDIYRAARLADCAQYLCEAHFLDEYTTRIKFYPRSRIDNIITWYDDDFDEEFNDHQHELGDKEWIDIRIALYVYRRATLDLDPNWLGHPNEAYKQTKQIHSPLSERSSVVSEAFYNVYGLDEYIRFSEFANQYGINDLHRGNIGTVDGQLQLIDYAGYHSSCDEDFKEYKYEQENYNFSDYRSN